jgi:hypothetical protein
MISHEAVCPYWSVGVAYAKELDLLSLSFGVELMELRS